MSTPDDAVSEPDGDSLWRAFLDAQARGEPIDFDRWCREHPGRADELRALRRAEELLAHGLNMKPGPVALPPELDSVLRNLRSRGPVASRYTLRGELGHGGMGIVHEAFDEDLRRTVAIKFIRDEFSAAALTEPRRLARFLEEAQVTGQLEHPSIVPVYELGIDEQSRVYYTMQLVEGETLARVFERVWDGEEGWTRERVLGVLLRVCEAVAFAHTRGVLHRDLKPSNVMVGAFGQVYVMDWGLARVLSRAESDHADGAAAPRRVETVRGSSSSASPELHTGTGQGAGTPSYMAPELTRGEAACGGALSDVYALGAMLYELLAGHAPYRRRGESSDPREVLRKLVVGPPEPLGRDTPSELVAICERAMAREPARRHRSVAELALDLRAYLEGRVVPSIETGTWAETRKWVKRNKALASALACVVLSVTGGAVAFAIQAHEAEVARDLAEHETREARLQRDTSDASLEFLVGLFRASDPSFARGRDLDARELLDNGLALIDARVGLEPRVRARLTLEIGSAYRGLGQYGRALELHESAIAQHSGLAGVDSRSRIHLLNEASTTAIFAGEKARCMAWLDEAERIAAEALPRDDPDLLALRATRCFLRSEQEGLGPVEGEWLALLAEQAAALGEAHEQTLTHRSNLAAAYLEDGQVEKALPLLQSVRDTIRAAEGERSPKALVAENHVAIALQKSGKAELAERTFQEVIRTGESVLGSGHHWVLNFRNNLATLYGDVGRYPEARDLLRANIEERRRGLGSDHPSTITDTLNLAAVLRRMKQRKEARALYDEALDLVRRRDGEGSLLEANVLLGLGALEEEERRFGKALEHYERFFAARGKERIDHPDLRLALGRLAEAYGQRGREREARPLLEELIELHERDAVKRPEKLLPLRFNLGVVLLNLGEFDAAEPVLQECLRGALELHGETHPATQIARANLAVLWGERGQFDRAIELHEAILATRRATAGPDAVETANALHNLATTCANAGRAEEALAHYLELIEIRERTLGPQDMDTVFSRNNLAGLYEDLGLWYDAEPIMRDVLAARRQALGPTNRLTLLAQRRLVDILLRTGQREEARVLARELFELTPFGDPEYERRCLLRQSMP